MKVPNTDMENLLYLFLLIHPATTAERIYSYWPKHKVLAEYPRPEKEELTKTVNLLKTEIRTMLIQV